MSSKTVILLQVLLKYEPELCIREVTALRKALGADTYPVMHGKRHAAFVTIRYGTPAELVERFRHLLEVDAFENYWALIPLKPTAGKFGGLDSLPSRIKFAYAALQAGPAKNFAQSKVFVKERYRKRAP
ncbi:hypothetical protein [Mesorhizobium sp.]|uniref:hypothetical protein n=1 Tax=Mesorhizobium sp. TaxID=1871066 RepID=UPI000FE961E1|nr:hypothetical protein [Mesorhizobium sp.]RWA66848.1 MAG: hypothetical protein EOQ29_26055 [Mesorhizobium sp.]TIS49432.1 MAG: hypothetical protein E5W96_12825 [Mesorhizobium sp.]